ncbi:MAG: cytochrome c3 family protein [Magnetococcales bacterium]|nr:cytochrome c3 family protein [Magnetococcales bacterium]
MKQSVKVILILNLAAIAVLTFVFPHLMISPGRLIDGHRAYETDCFACHDLFLGAASENCMDCHKVDDIGLRTTNGAPVTGKKTTVPFHQKLLGQECVACHSDHAGVAKYRIRQRFSHILVDTTTREQCASCHKAKRPADALHRQLSDKCAQCHGTEKWKPATFDHTRWFRFDRHHPAKCTDCHPKNTYERYTCYECHEHSVAKIRQEHLEEGMRDFQNCTACHKSGNEDEAERIWREMRRRGISTSGIGKGQWLFDDVYRERGGFQRRNRDYDKDDDHDDHD